MRKFKSGDKVVYIGKASTYFNKIFTLTKEHTPDHWLVEEDSVLSPMEKNLIHLEVFYSPLYQALL